LIHFKLICLGVFILTHDDRDIGENRPDWFKMSKIKDPYAHSAYDGAGPDTVVELPNKETANGG